MNKPIGKLSSGTTRQLWLLALPLLIQAIPSAADAQPVKLLDGNASAMLNPSSDQTMTSLVVDGQSQLALQGFYYRVGGTGGESSISTVPLVNQVQSTASTLSVTYANGLFRIETDYSLVGGAAGSGSASLSEQIKITNLGAVALDFHFFQYTDFDLGGTSMGDTVQLGQNLQGFYNEALQTQGPGILADTVVTPGATRGQVGGFPTLISSLTDGSPTILNNNSGPYTGDASWALQWDVVIAAGGSYIIGIDKNLYVPVPEPTTFSLVSIGVALFSVLRRNRRS